MIFPGLKSPYASNVPTDHRGRHDRILPICFQLFVGVGMVMLMRLRTGEMFDSSTARFAVMTTAILSQDDAPP